MLRVVHRENTRRDKREFVIAICTGERCHLGDACSYLAVGRSYDAVMQATEGHIELHAVRRRQALDQQFAADLASKH